MMIFKKSITDLFKNTNFRIFLIIIFAFILYFPFVFLGYGSDNDSYGVVNTAKVLITKKVYQYSRPPGYFIHELFSSILIYTGGSISSNIGALTLLLITVFFFIKICQFYKIENLFLLSLILIIHPMYWINSTCTIDYIWAIGFFFIGYYIFLKNSFFLTAFFFALSIGSRITSILLFLAVFVVYFIKTRNIKILIAFIICIILSCIFYIPQFIYAGYNLTFIKYYIGKWSVYEYLIRFVYKNIYFWGLLTFLFIFILTIFNYKKFFNILKDKNEFHILAVLIIFLFELLFLKIPLENESLLPMLPFFIILLGIIFQHKKIFIYILFLFIFSLNFININILKVDQENNAKKGEIGIFIEKGYLLNDIQKRIDMIIKIYRNLNAYCCLYKKNKFYLIINGA